MNRALLPSHSLSRFPVSLSLIFSLAGVVLHSSGVPLRADFTAEERETREDQLHHVAGIVDPNASKTETKNALLGMLILRDDQPERTAGSRRRKAEDSATAPAVELRRHILACTRCRDLGEVTRPRWEFPARQARTPEPTAVEKLRPASRPVVGGLGCLPSAETRAASLPAARALVREVVLACPDDPEALQLYAHNLALLNIRQGLYRQAQCVLEFARSRTPSCDNTRLLAWLHRFPESRHLVSARDALHLMEMVVREERSPEKLTADHRYLTELRTEVWSPWAVRPAGAAVRCRVDHRDNTWER